ncbi:hypothetical protein NEIPOLOT_01154 [Neisseria polysaccharea ATCC 43768]|nr:hypothetical protein NEIPOLOT_01154 [Neisseria polysaccharea ATCC 43768]
MARNRLTHASQMPSEPFQTAFAPKRTVVPKRETCDNSRPSHPAPQPVLRRIPHTAFVPE